MIAIFFLNKFMTGMTVAVRSSVRAAFALFAALFTLSNAHAIEPIPSFYQEPGLSRNRDYVNQHMNEHVDPFTGKLQLHYVDLFIPGNGGMDIKVQRSYNSQDELLREPNVTGTGWTIHFGRVSRRALVGFCQLNNVATTNAPVLELPDGSKQILYLSLDQLYFISANRYRADCATNGAGMVVTSPDGMRYEMTTPGTPVPVGASPVTQQNSYYTTRMVDRNGNTLNFSYTSVNGLTAISQITSSDGRTVTFNYTGSALASISDGSRTWRYSYDTSNPSFPFLTEVVRPDGLRWRYAYNMTPGAGAGVYSMKQLTYPTGGSLDYAYGFVQFNESLPRTTVVTSKKARANTSPSSLPGDWTYSYNPAPRRAPLVNGAYSFNETNVDRTYVTAPDGVHAYFHIGANSVGSGAIYGIGLLLAKSLDGGYQNEGTGWTAQVISNMENARPGTPNIIDGRIAVPIAAAQAIQRNGQTYQTSYSNFDQYGNARTVVESGTTISGLTDTRTTQRTFNILTGKWILHQVKDETIATAGSSTTSAAIARTFDGAGNLLAENKYGVTTEFSYTPQGDVATKRDARGNTVTYSSYNRGIAQSEAHPESVTITRTIDNAGNVASQTDGEGATTQYAYDGLNRLIGITLPAGNPVGITWGANTRVVQRGLFKETTNYDGFGRTMATSIEGGAGGPIVQTHFYDAMGRKSFTSYFNQNVGTVFRNDVLGRTWFTGHVGQLGGISGYIVNGGSTSSYFAYNQVTNVTERNLAYTLTYRGYGSPDHLDLLQVVAPDPAANIAITRNGMGQPLTVTQGGLSHTYGYDSRFFLINETIPETGTTVYGRDAVGNMTSKQVATSPVTNYVYDGRNRLTAIQYPAGTPSVTKTWYRDDLIRTIDNGVARRDYVYSPNKKLTRETLLVSGQTFGVDHTYDLNDAHATVAYSTGLTVNYNPDALGWATQAMPFASGVTFHPNGALKQLRYSNGLLSNFTIDARQRPNNLQTVAPGGQFLLNITNTYDNSNNVTTITDSVTGQQNRSFGYDALDRLTTVSMPGIFGGRITYNGSGNILSQQLGPVSLLYQYGANNRLTGITGSRTQTLAYDVYGNVTANSRNQFQYDDGSMLRCVDCGTPNEIRYDYDGAGTRVSETKGPFKTYFIYGNSGELLFEVDANGVKREYGYVAGRNIARKVTQ